jgi:hypothetical protein
MVTWKLIIRILVSTIFGGLFYSIWLSVYLLLSPDKGLAETFLWLIAPTVTALGFASGLTIANRFSKDVGTPFFRIFIWPLVGCIIGAVTVYWFGPMLIVFSMLALGAVSVAAREVFSAR